MAVRHDVRVNAFDLRLVLAAHDDGFMRDEPAVRNAKQRLDTAVADIFAAGDERHPLGCEEDPLVRLLLDNWNGSTIHDQAAALAAAIRANPGVI